MTTSRWLRVFVSVVVVAAVGIVAQAEEEEGKLNLPDSVVRAFKATFPKGEIAKADVEEEGGVQVYDLEFRDGTTERECDMAADGTILNTAIVVDPKSVPEAAMSALNKAASGGAIKRVEKSEIFAEPKAGKIVKLDKVRIEYEAEIEKAGRHGEVTVAADGTLVEGPKWGNEKD